jgi:hypothetical protein
MTWHFFGWVPPNAIGLYVSYFTFCWFSLGGIAAYKKKAVEFLVYFSLEKKYSFGSLSA